MLCVTASHTQALVCTTPEYGTQFAVYPDMERNRQKSDTLLAAVLGVFTLTATANDRAVESHDTIREAARQHVLAAADQFPVAPKVTVGRLDSRLKLAACDQTLQSYDAPNGLSGGRGVVGVRCEGSKPWKIYVPVQVALMESIVVSRRPLVRGQTLGADDVMLSQVDTSRLHKAYFVRIEDVVGLRSKRAVGSGKTLHAGMLEREKLVKRGSQVEIVSISDGLQVRMRGKALGNGGQGDRIKVKNLNSGRVVTGTVASNGVIRVLH